MKYFVIVFKYSHNTHNMFNGIFYVVLVVSIRCSLCFLCQFILLYFIFLSTCFHFVIIFLFVCFFLLFLLLYVFYFAFSFFTCLFFYYIMLFFNILDLNGLILYYHKCFIAVNKRFHCLVVGPWRPCYARRGSELKQVPLLILAHIFSISFFVKEEELESTSLGRSARSWLVDEHREAT